MARCSNRGGSWRCKRKARPGYKRCAECAAIQQKARRKHRRENLEKCRETSRKSMRKWRRENLKKDREKRRVRYTNSLAVRIYSFLARDKRQRCHNPPPDLEPTIYNARVLLEWLKSVDGNYYCGAKRGGCKMLIDPAECRNGAAPSLDHALSRLEAHWAGVEWHRASNLQLLHRDCHLRKDTVVIGDLHMREVKNPRSERC